ncbi:hypothetical protein MPSEU_001005800 [Mayamaea pseudoterrestris]|nr:hypothetical protein MPSEU_001005800 [Mayamaea pseudoterrestris]
MPRTSPIIDVIHKVPKHPNTMEGHIMWHKQICVYARLAGCNRPISIHRDPFLPATEAEAIADAPIGASDEQKQAVLEQRAARKQNEMLMCLYTMTLPGELSFIISFAETAEYPSGEAHRVLAALERRFTPSFALARSIYQKRLDSLQHERPSANPRVLIDAMFSLAAQYRQTVTSTAFTGFLMSKLPAYYQLALTKAQNKQLGEAIDIDTIERIIFASYDAWWYCIDEDHEVNDLLNKRMYNVLPNEEQQGQSSRDNDRQGPSQDNGQGNIVGRTRRCTLRCYICQVYGHRAIHCFELDENESFRPRLWQSRLTEEQGREAQALYGSNRSSDILHDQSKHSADHRQTMQSQWSENRDNVRQEELHPRSSSHLSRRGTWRLESALAAADQERVSSLDQRRNQQLASIICEPSSIDEREDQQLASIICEPTTRQAPEQASSADGQDFQPPSRSIATDCQSISSRTSNSSSASETATRMDVNIADPDVRTPITSSQFERKEKQVEKPVELLTEWEFDDDDDSAMEQQQSNLLIERAIANAKHNQLVFK